MAANEDVYDAYVRHQINIQRMSRKEAADLLKLLRASEKDLDGMITATGGNWTKRRLSQVRGEVERLRTAAWQSFGDGLKGVMEKTAHVEIAAGTEIMESVLPVEINFAAPNAAAVRTAATGTPFGDLDKMQTLAEWVVKLSDADRGRIMGALQAAVVNGETVPQIQRRIMKATSLSQFQAEALARTGINHASNTARNTLFQENAGILDALRVVATLDGRTTPICRSYDGKHRPVSGDDFEGVPEPHLPSASLSPPFHLRCRSLMIGILSGESLADQLGSQERITVTDRRTGKQRQVDFEKDARARYNAQRKEGDPTWGDLPPGEKSPYRSAVRREWADQHVGSVPADTTYDSWLRKQDADFQDQVLGKPRAELYRKEPGMTMDTFIDADGNMMTIEELHQLIRCTSPCIVMKAPARAEFANPTERTTANVVQQRQLEADLREANPNVTDNEIKRLRREELSKLVPPGEDPAEFQTWLDSLTREEKDTLLFWTTEDGPKPIRDAMRGLNKDPVAIRQAEIIMGAIERAPQYRGPAYRGAVTDKLDFKVGQIIDDNAVGSWSFHPGVAAEYATARGRQFSKHSVIYRHDDAASGVNISFFGDPYESEILRPSGRYEILEVNSVQVDTFGRTETVTEVVLRALPL